MKKRFSLLFILSLLIVGNFILPAFAWAQTDDLNAKPNSAENINVKMQVPLPFVKTTDGKVNNLKDYIEGFYKLLIGVGAVFAVVMIIVAGYQWMTSGGSSGIAGDAKKRIWNATIGLVLALLSYIILNTISPRLVSLELPKIDPIPRIGDGNQNDYCDTNVIIKARYGSADTKEQESFLALNDGSEINFNTKLEDAICGNEYLVTDDIGKCLGSKCTGANEGKVCMNRKCTDGVMYGDITWDSKDLFPNNYVDKVLLRPVCNRLTWIDWVPLSDGRTASREIPVNGRSSYQINTGDISALIVNKDTSTRAKLIEALMSSDVFCTGNAGGLKGFVLEIEVNDTSNKWTPTNDDRFILNKNCSVPISSVNSSGNLTYKRDEINWGEVKQSDLWQPVDFTNAVLCNIKVDDKTFPPR